MVARARRPGLMPAALAATLLWLPGCASDGSGPDRTTGSAAPASPVPPASDPAGPATTVDPPDPTGPSEPPSEDPGLPVACDPATEAAVATPVAAQLDALAAGDFAAAYAQASPFFRTVVTRERFEALIREGYPELLDVAARRLEGCTVLNRRAALVVTVTTTPGARRTLAYELSDTDEGWRIDGAQDMAPPRPAPPDPEV